MRRDISPLSTTTNARRSFRDSEEIDLEVLQDLAIAARDFYQTILKSQERVETPYGCNALDELVDYALSDFMAAIHDTVRTGDRFAGSFDRRPSSYLPDYD